MVEEPPDDLFEKARLHGDRREGASMRMRRPMDPLWAFEMTRLGLRCRKHPIAAEHAHWLQDLVVDIDDGQVNVGAAVWNTLLMRQPGRFNSRAGFGFDRNMGTLDRAPASFRSYALSSHSLR